MIISDTGDAHVKVVEFQHQQYIHAESVSGFETGQDQLRKRVLAGHYCMERMLFDTGPVGAGVLPKNLCFDVPVEGSTQIWVSVDPTGGISFKVENANPLEDPDPQIAGPD